MSFSKAFRTAFGRSVDVAKNSTAAILRMDVTPSAATRGPLPLWQISKPGDVDDFATGCDKDMGGLSSVKVDLAQGSAGRRAVMIPRAGDGVAGDAAAPVSKPTEFEPEASHHGRFWGTLSNQVPRGAGLERAGYAAFRNRNRPTLFGAQTWDVSLYPYLAVRVRNNAALPSSAEEDASHIPSISDLLDRSGTAAQRARSALGYGVSEPPGPKYFVNIQTDGPVTSDLYQHRLWLNPHKTNGWQTVVIPLDAFLLLNTGTVSMAQVSMLKEGLRTVGISAVLEAPQLPASARDQIARSASSTSSSSPNSAQYPTTAEDEAGAEGDGKDAKVNAAASPTTTPSSLAARGAKRGQSYRFDLGVAGVHAVGSVEEGIELWQ